MPKPSLSKAPALSFPQEVLNDFVLLGENESRPRRLKIIQEITPRVGFSLRYLADVFHPISPQMLLMLFDY